MIVLDYKPKRIPSKVHKYKDPDFGGKKTYFIDDDNYLTRWVIANAGKEEIPKDIYERCITEQRERTNSLRMWSEKRFQPQEKLVIGKNLILDPYQTSGVVLMGLLKRAILNMDMGTGKTAVTIGWWTYFCNKTMIVVCPKNVIQEWVEQFEKFLGVTPKVIKHMTEYKSSEELGIGEDEIAPVYITHYDMFRKQRKNLRKTDIIVFDEVHRGAGLTSLTHKTMYDFSMKAERVYGLSGSIVGNHFEDILGIYSTVDPLIYGIDKMNFYNAWTKYILDEYNQPQVYDYKNWDSFSLRFHSISHTVMLEDVIDMPNREDEFVYCTKDPNYNKLIKDYIFTAEGINIETGERDLRLFTVDRALNMTMKLMQLCSGFIKDFEGNWIRINNLKRDALKEWLNDKWEGIKDHKRKVVLFYQFNISGDDIEEVLKDKKIIYRRIDGSISDKNKDYYKHLFKTAEFGDSEGCDVIVINYGTGTEGMNFQRGTVMGFYDQTLEFRKKEQAERRIYRRGQEEDCLYVHFVTEKSKEVETFQKLAKIKDFSLWLNEVKEL